MTTSKRLSIRAFRSVDAVVKRLAMIQQAIVTGVALGSFDDAALVELDESYYHEHTNYRGDAYNRRGLWDWEQRFVDGFLAPGSSVLVTAAGGGREVLALEAQGFRVDAFECNEALRSAGNDLLERAGATARIAAADRDGCPALGHFDAAIVGWGSYTLIGSRQRRIDFMRALRAQVADGGPILISFFRRKGDETGLAVVAAIANAIRRLRRASAVELGDSLSPNRTHSFTDAEVDDELAAAGLGPVAHRDHVPYAHVVVRA